MSPRFDIKLKGIRAQLTERWGNAKNQRLPRTVFPKPLAHRCSAMPADFTVVRRKSSRQCSIDPFHDRDHSVLPSGPVRRPFDGARHLWLMCTALITGAVAIRQVRQRAFTSSQPELSNLGTLPAGQTSRRVQSVDLVPQNMQSRYPDIADRRGMRLLDRPPRYDRVILHPSRDYPLAMDANVSVQAILENRS